MTAEEVLEEVKKAAAENNGVAYSNRCSSLTRQSAIKYFGGWDGACFAAGVVSARQATQARTQERLMLHDNARNGNREKVDTTKSICPSCKRSLALAGIQCSFTKRLEFPQGCKYVEKLIMRGKKEQPYTVYIVTECPEYLPDDLTRRPPSKHNKNYKELAHAIVMQAANDYMSAGACKYTRAECTAFFKSEFYEQLCKIDGSAMLQMLDEERARREEKRGQ